ncbi:MAG: MoxR family ATPase [Flavobacteriales bacterium]|nr:MoxR family ATPase [Flavobacteriales bacterium]MBT3963261.1 MoxR family ATPase [Flavobacteriales bacterium]MBT4704270.1 MoxR family ATPase [Flavobacteriales bacterium]MBT4930574.1 MoxR family ATPase [Flavobacteriales bacterium]MBT5131849.1 MoxR family ATPase [Flavobacteriales bacterium]
MKEYKDEVEAADDFGRKVRELKAEVAKIIVGQDDVIDAVLTSVFSNGHCLLVGVPGLAKTLLVNTLADVLGLSFSRIQFTPDLMPSDIVGSEILDDQRNFKFIKGPIFANIVLADEINRTPPKTQSALLEAMQERMVTAAGHRYTLDAPFFVLATQNPIEQEGTYPLPEAQLDRFMFNIWVDYPTFEEELSIVKATTGDNRVELSTVMTAEEILFFQNLVRKVPVPDGVIDYAVRLANSTRPGVNGSPEMTNEFVNWGAGPRASQYLILGAKCHALMNGKYSPDNEDVRAVATNVLRHRIVRNYKAEAEGVSTETIIDELMQKATL